MKSKKITTTLHAYAIVSSAGKSRIEFWNNQQLAGFRRSKEYKKETLTLERIATIINSTTIKLKP